MQIKNITCQEGVEENLQTWCFEIGSRFEKMSIDSVKEFNKFFQEKKIKNKKILDLGAGDGAATNELLKCSFDVTAVDINLEKLGKIQGANAVCADALTYIESQKYLNNVFTHHSLEHMVQAEEIIEQIGRKMAPKCLYYAAVPAGDYLHSVHHIVFENFFELLPSYLTPILLQERERYEEKEFVCIAQKK